MSYHNLRIQIKEGSPLYNWCDNVTKSANNLYNTALFIERQLRSGLRKKPSDRFENETDVLQQIESALTKMNAIRESTYKTKKEKYRKSNNLDKTEPKLKLFTMPTSENYIVWFGFLDALFKVTKNSDYYCEFLPRHSAQQVLKNVCRNIKAFFAAIKAYNQDKSKFTGEPKFPAYHRKGGNTTTIISNQECRITHNKNGFWYAKLPKTKDKCCLGKSISGKLKEVHICPHHRIFDLNFVFETSEELPEVTKTPCRICAIDFGVNNLASITNNIGKPFLLFKGGVVKSVNQWYNKQMAKIMSEQTKGTIQKFVPTPESQRLGLRREACISDFMHKTAKRITEWCCKDKIDTIVMGINKGWKQDSNLSKVNNQNFVQIPFYKLQSYVKYLATRHGVLVIEQEESYTSKASFLDEDYIPVYKKGDEEKYNFSGYRESRGLYKLKGRKEILNADFNGSANIGRKAFPDLFTPKTCNGFNNVIVFKHPDQVMIKENQRKQKQRCPKKEVAA